MRVCWGWPESFWPALSRKGWPTTSTISQACARCSASRASLALVVEAHALVSMCCRETSSRPSNSMPASPSFSWSWGLSWPLGMWCPPRFWGLRTRTNGWQTEPNDNGVHHLSTRRSSSVARRHHAERAENHPSGWFFDFSSHL